MASEYIPLSERGTVDAEGNYVPFSERDKLMLPSDRTPTSDLSFGGSTNMALLNALRQGTEIPDRTLSVLSDITTPERREVDRPFSMPSSELIRPYSDVRTIDEIKEKREIPDVMGIIDVAIGGFATRMKEEEKFKKEWKDLPIVKQYKAWGFEVPEEMITGYDKDGIPLGPTDKRLLYTHEPFAIFKGKEFAQQTPNINSPEYQTYKESTSYYMGNVAAGGIGYIDALSFGTLGKATKGEVGVPQKDLLNLFGVSDEKQKDIFEKYYASKSPKEVTSSPIGMMLSGMLGEFTKFYSLYANIGPGVEKLVGPTVSRVISKVAFLNKFKEPVKVLIVEGLKDAVISVPVTTIEAFNSGLRDEDLKDFIITQATIDLAANFLFYKLGKLRKPLAEVMPEIKGDVKIIKLADEVAEAVTKADPIAKVITGITGMPDVAMTKTLASIDDYISAHIKRAEISKLNYPFAEVKIKELSDIELSGIKVESKKTMLEDIMTPKKISATPEVMAKTKLWTTQELMKDSGKKFNPKKLYETLRTAFDPEYTTKQFGGNVYYEASNALHKSAQIEMMVTEEMFLPSLTKTGKGLKSIISEIPSGKGIYRGIEMDNVELVEWYLYTKHNIATSKAGLDTLEALNSKQSKAIVDLLENDYPWLKQINEDVRVYTKTLLDWAVDSRRISQKQATDLIKKYPDWVKTIRDIQKWYDPTIQRPLTTDFLKTLVGGEGDIKSVWDSLAKYTNDVITNSTEQTWKISLYETVKKNPSKYKNVIEITGKKSSVPLDSIDNVFKEMDGRITPEFEIRGNVVDMYLDGKLVQLTIYDKNLFDRWFGGKPFNMNVLEKVISPATKTFKKYTTQESPIFAAKNLPRDTQQAFTWGSENNPVKFLNQLTEAADEMVANTELFKMYKRAGITGSTYSGTNTAKADASAFLKTVHGVGKPIKSALKTLSVASYASENVNRFAEFIRVIRKTGNMSKAVYEASDITVNFAKGGPTLKHLEVISPYSKAASLGAEKRIRQLVNKPVATLLKSALLAAPSLALYIAVRSNPNFVEDITEYERANFLILPNLFGRKDEEGYYEEFNKIPMGRDDITVIHSLLVNVLRLMTGEDDVGWDETLKALVGSFGPSNPVNANILSAYYELKANKNRYGTQITPERLMGLEEKLQYTSNTSEIGKFWGKLAGNATGLSPIEVDYLIDRYTGIIGDFILPATTKGTPFYETFTRAFTIDTVFQNKNVNDFYDLRKELTVKMKSEEFINKGGKEAWVAGYKYDIITDNANKINEYYSIIRDIEKETMNNVELEDMLKKVYQLVEDVHESTLADEQKSKEIKEFTELARDILKGDMTYKQKEDWEIIIRRKIIEQAKDALSKAKEAENFSLEEIISLTMNKYKVDEDTATKILEELIRRQR